MEVYERLVKLDDRDPADLVISGKDALTSLHVKLRLTIGRSGYSRDLPTREGDGRWWDIAWRGVGDTREADIEG
jgi:hypothetical protein